MRPNVLLRVAQATVLLLITTGIAPLTNAAPLASAFTYQGQLSDGPNRATGLYDFAFDLYDAATSGTRVGDTIQIDGLPVSNGLFSVSLDFGATAFDGNARWLQIHVRANGGLTAVTLSPRQPLRATPYSLFSLTSGALNGVLPDSQLSGNIARLNTPQTFAATVSFSPPSGPPFTVSSSERVPNLNADLLDGLDSTAFAPATHEHDNLYWKLFGHGGTTPGTHFLGTTDNQPLELKVNGQRALRLEPNTTAPNVIGGHSGNLVIGASGVTISGGGRNGSSNVILETNNIDGRFMPHQATISGGSGNTIIGASLSLISGGSGNAITGDRLYNLSGYSGIGGGLGNRVRNASYATIGGGQNNLVSGDRDALVNNRSTIGGGLGNVIDGSINASIGGGNANKIQFGATEATIGGGGGNNIDGFGEGGGDTWTYGATIGGGSGNSMRGTFYGTIAGGWSNVMRGTVTPGLQLSTGTIGGGSGNTIVASSTSCTIAGGSGNLIGKTLDGWRTTACVIGGGNNNVIPAPSTSSTISGGSTNRIFGDYGIIPGGVANVATNHSFAAGRRAKAIHNGSFVWGDATDADVSSTATNQFTVRASGGTRVFSDSASTVGVQLLPGDNAWSVLSDRNAKQNLEAVDCAEVLEKVAALPVTTWQLKSQPDSVRHMGPMAQDFQAAFGLGASERVINTSDADGVALAAIKGLNNALHDAIKAKDKEISDLKTRLEKLERLIAER